MEPSKKSFVVATLLGIIGSAIVFGALMLAVFFPRMNVGVAIAIGALLGTPFIALSLHLQSRANTPHAPKIGFWPTGKEVSHTFWGFVAFMTVLGCFVVPVGLALAVAYLLPTGDDWGIVLVRLSVIGLCILITYYCSKFAISRIPDWFGSKISQATLTWLTHAEPTNEPKNARSAALRYWQLAIVGVAAFSIAFGVIDLNNPLLDLEAGPKQTRGLIQLIQWCRGNPNTVVSSSMIIGIVASFWYILKIRSAALTVKKESPTVPLESP